MWRSIYNGGRSTPLFEAYLRHNLMQLLLPSGAYSKTLQILPWLGGGWGDVPPGHPYKFP